MLNQTQGFLYMVLSSLFKPLPEGAKKGPKDVPMASLK